MRRGLRHRRHDAWHGSRCWRGPGQRELRQMQHARRNEIDRRRRQQHQQGRPHGRSHQAADPVAGVEPGMFAERGVQAFTHVFEPVAARRRQRPAHALRERAGEGGVGQFVEPVGLEQLELARRDLDGRGERRDMQALRLARLAQQRTRRGPHRGLRLGVGRITHRTVLGRRRTLHANRGIGCAAAHPGPAPRPGCRACSRPATRATGSARWRRWPAR